MQAEVASRLGADFKLFGVPLLNPFDKGRRGDPPNHVLLLGHADAGASVLPLLIGSVFPGSLIKDEGDGFNNRLP